MQSTCKVGLSINRCELIDIQNSKSNGSRHLSAKQASQKLPSTMFSQIQPKNDLFGLPLPSDDPAFIAVILIHILLSFCAVLAGLAGMFMNKNSRRHATFGKLYYWFILLAFVTVIILAILRWPHNNHLLLIGAMTTLFVLIGRKLAQDKRSKWARWHTILMGGSYILLLTGFYVDNGEHLPFWKQFPQWFFYILPAMVGIPIIVFVLRRHPLTRT